MNEPTEEQVVSLVKSKFDVSEITQNSEMLKFKIEVEDFKEKFVEISQKLEKQGIACKILRKNNHLYLIARRLAFREQSKFRATWIPRILFAIVIGFVLIDGYNRTLSANAIDHIGNPTEMAVIYTIALVGILGIHELGHLVASRIHKIKTTWPYFIPGIPIGTLPLMTIPTFGALIMGKGLMINREKTFDVAIAGPIAGLVIAIIVSIYAAYTAPIIDPFVSEQLYESGQWGKWQFGEPLLLIASLALFEKSDGAGEVLMTPLLFAAWIGFFLTFLNLMPAGQLDGGHMIRAMFGRKILRVFTYISAGVLLLMNIWIGAVFVLMMSGKNSGVSIMDDITPLTKKRKISYVIVMGLMILCAPIPDTIIVIEPLLHLTQ